MLKLLILKHSPDFYLIGNVTELDEEPSLLIENCYRVTAEGALEEFPRFTDQRDLFLTSDLIFTILDPSATLADLYKATVG
ncbi:hypothetical protein SSZBM1_149 [Synechococcus phage S-SZBM1]|uniref:Uncharacterized protein n=1 Tax=Synechococcus phage S-SZBM1 TaxID=2926475 RepID=A0AC61TSY4_9CAUD|nr:hypothetical protein PP650_gp127 [Synechococcus phage S-SZBM1]UNH61266.1 hypothetical protein SSZBM1_149 [Synechococcus phage S-SZBM1]